MNASSHIPSLALQLMDWYLDHRLNVPDHIFISCDVDAEMRPDPLCGCGQGCKALVVYFSMDAENAVTEAETTNTLPVYVQPGSLSLASATATHILWERSMSDLALIDMDFESIEERVLEEG